MSEPVNARMLAALKDALDTHDGIGAFATGKLKASMNGTRKVMVAAIAEAEAQAKPDAPSYRELLCGLKKAWTEMLYMARVGNSIPRDKTVKQTRDLLKRAKHGH